MQHWESFSPELRLQEIFTTSADIQELLNSGRLILDDRWLIVIFIVTHCLIVTFYD